MAKAKTPPESYEGYCVRCGDTVGIEDPKIKKTKNGRRMAQGMCANGCGTKVSRFLKG